MIKKTYGKKHVNYKRIFEDILKIKYPQKMDKVLPLLYENELSSIDVLKINNMIFEVKQTEGSLNHRTYNRSDIVKILEYQKENNLTNTAVAKHYKMSRNTISKWKKKFLVK